MSGRVVDKDATALDFLRFTIAQEHGEGPP